MDHSAQLTGVTRSLVLNNLLHPETIEHARHQTATKHTVRLTDLVNEKNLSAKKAALCLAAEFNLPLFDLNAFDKTLFPTGILSDQLISEYHVLPLLQQGKKLYIAISDPTNQDILNQIRFQTGNNIIPILVEEDKLAFHIQQKLTAQVPRFNQLAVLQNDDTDLETIDITDIATEEVVSSTINDEAPIIRFVNKIILNAINTNSSDIHFEPYENEYRIRYRQDGVLKEIAKPSANLAGRLASRLKVMANLDISEKRLPQDGRFKMKISDKHSIGFRVSSCPTLFGEKIVLRILDPTITAISIEKLGFEQREQLLFEEALAKPQGMILVTGPTGSGKTVTLYTALHILNRPELNISTVEDPIEIYLSGINQVNVNEKTGFSFSNALRAFLRQDPDVIMVGEIRDTQTGEIAINAAQTGHLVLSTLHTKSAADTLARLNNMGISAFNIASSVTLIIAQRLIRCLCPKCKEPLDLSKDVLLKEGFSEKELSTVTIYKAVGCKNCYDGYRGQTGIYEVMPITPAIEALILSNASPSEISAQALREGMINLRQAGLIKVKNGISTFEEVDRVTLL